MFVTDHLLILLFSMSAWTAENLKATLNLISTLVRVTVKDGKVPTGDQTEAKPQATEVIQETNVKPNLQAKGPKSHHANGGD